MINVLAYRCGSLMTSAKGRPNLDLAADTRLPRAVHEFLAANVESHEQLEILLLLSKSRELAWEVSAIAKKALLPEDAVVEALRTLAQKRLVSRAHANCAVFHYAPETVALDAIVCQLADSYETCRLDITRVMSAKSIERLQASAAAFLTSTKKDGFSG
jgi:hypothetical protein